MQSHCSVVSGTHAAYHQVYLDSNSYSADIFSDSVLIAIPLWLSWNINITRSQRIRLLLVFSSSLFTTAVSLVHAYYVLTVGGQIEVLFGIVEVRPFSL